MKIKEKNTIYVKFNTFILYIFNYKYKCRIGRFKYLIHNGSGLKENGPQGDWNGCREDFH